MAARVAVFQIGVRIQTRLPHLEVGHQMAAGGTDVSESKAPPFQVTQGMNTGIGRSDEVGVELHIAAALHQGHDAVPSMRLDVRKTAEISEVERTVPQGLNGGIVVGGDNQVDGPS